MSQFIQVSDGVIDEKLCKSLIEQFELNPELQRAGRTGDGVDRSKKLSDDILLDAHEVFHGLRRMILERVHAHLLAYADRFSSLLVGSRSPTVRSKTSGDPVALDLNNYPTEGRPYLPALMNRLYRPGAIVLQRYRQGMGGYPHWHSEIYPQPTSNEALTRVLFWLCYLNEVESGGETEFAYQEYSVRPKAGRLVVAPAGFTHTHRGTVPKSGDKYILASWVLFRTEDPPASGAQL